LSGLSPEPVSINRLTDMINYQTLNREQVFSMCSINPFESGDKVNSVVMNILAAFATHGPGDESKLVDTLKRLIENSANISIGKSLEKLYSVSTIPDEFDGDHDGLDALCYHLGGNQVNNAIKALNAINNRFREMEEKTD